MAQQPATGSHKYGPAGIIGLRSRAAGFSMLELAIVLAMILAATTIAVPSMVTVVANANLHKGMSSLASVFQNGRTLAVKQNTISRIRFQLNNKNWVAYVDNGLNPAGLTTSSAQLWLPRNFSKVAAPSGTNPTPLDTATCGSTISPDTTDDTYFNQLGIPCQYSSGTCSSSQAFAYYFTYQGTLNMSTSWAAMCVSPAGRFKAWYWSGSAWKN
ncbi:MAG: pilus assembly FimT family protein [Terriglobales bacterium]|jgi:Tfp pilus assembly protein FimT